MLVSPDFDTVQKSLRWSCPNPENIVEVRTLTTYRGYASVGYFNDPILAANTIVNGDSEGIAGTYATLNPVVPDALARCSNRMVSGRDAVFTHDKEILERRGLLLDFDPVRLSGISSTDEEHRNALDRMLEVTTALTHWYGWPVPCLIDSGNGGHARYMLERMRNDPEATELIKMLLRALDAKFSTDLVTIDKTVFNAARIVRIPGTVARKGEHTPERPHRVSRILRDYDSFDVLHRKAIERVTGPYASVQPTRSIGAVRRSGEYPADEQVYRQLNLAARDRFHEWVPPLLGDLARPSGDGYRIDSDRLGRDLEEAISINAMGIKDFGVADMGDATEGRRTAITLLADLVFNGSKREAAVQLSLTLNAPLNEFEGKALQELPTPGINQPDPINMPGSLMGIGTELAGFRKFSEIMYDEVQPVTYLVQDLVADNTHTVLSAPSKTGKSTFSRDMMLHLLFGMPFLGKAVRQCRIIYIALEDRTERLKRVILERFNDLVDIYNWEFTAQQREEAFSRLQFVTMDSDKQIGKDGTRLPMGEEGAERIRNEIRTDPSVPWFVLIEPVARFHEEVINTKNLNRMEDQQIQVINGIISEKEYTCSVLSVKHNRKTSSGSKTVGVTADDVSGSAAQTGSPDAIMMFYRKANYNFDTPAYLIIQARDFSTKPLTLVSDGRAWVLPPPDADLPEYEDYLTNPVDGRGRKMKDPQLQGKIVSLLTANPAGKRVREIEQALNISYQIILRQLRKMNDEGLIYMDKRNNRDILYMISCPVRLPDVL